MFLGATSATEAVQAPRQPVSLTTSLTEQPTVGRAIQFEGGPLASIFEKGPLARLAKTSDSNLACQNEKKALDDQQVVDFAEFLVASYHLNTSTAPASNN